MNYELAIAVTYIGMTAIILWLSTEFTEETYMAKGVRFFLTIIGFYMIWLGIGNAHNMALANAAPSGIVNGLEVTYWVLLITFSVIIIFMFVELIGLVLNWFNTIRTRGKQ